MKEKIAKITKTNSWFSEKISKTDKASARLRKKRRQETQTNKIKNDQEEVTIDNTEIQSIIRDTVSNYIQ